MRITLAVEADGFNKEAVADCTIPDQAAFKVVAGELMEVMRDTLVKDGVIPAWCRFCDTDGHALADCPELT